jgi:hypothetical protein
MRQRHNPRNLTADTAVPLSTTGIYRLSIAFAVFTFIADITSFVAVSNYGVIIKYGYTLIILLLIGTYFLRWRSFDTNTLAPLLALIFFGITATTFLVNLFLYGQKASYVTAFTSPLIFAAAAFVPSRTIVFDGHRILKHLLWLFSFGTFCYLIEVLLKFSVNPWRDIVYFNELEPTKPVVCILAICLSILLDRKLLACALMAITAVTLGFRPTTSLLLLLLMCGPLAVALRMRFVGIIRVIAYGILVAAALGPLMLYFYFDDVSQFVEQAESYVKVDVLGGISNSAFRLTIAKYAFEALDKSFWFGNGLNGETSVLLAREYAWWLNVTTTGMAEIHSDFIIVLTQAGIVGYTLFVWFFYSMLSVRFLMLGASASCSEDVGTLTALSIIALILLIVDCSFNPFLPVFQTVHPIWMLLFISETARKSILMPKLAARTDHKPAIEFKFAR